MKTPPPPEYGTTAVAGHIPKKNNTTGLKRKPNESTFNFKSRVVKAGLKQKCLKRTAHTQPIEDNKRTEKPQSTKQLLLTKKHLEQELNQLNHSQQPTAGHILYKQTIMRLK